MDIPKKYTELLRQGSFSHTEGFGTTANGLASHAEGFVTTAGLSENVGVGAHSEGIQTLAQNNADHAEGFNTIASGITSHAEGYQTTAAGIAAHAEGFASSAAGSYAHAEGQNTAANGLVAHAEGFSTTAAGIAAHTEGFSSAAAGNYSHAEGVGSTANGISSHAEGWSTMASGEASHAEGTFDADEPAFITRALARGSHAEGIGTQAGVNNVTGPGAHAEGFRTIASGEASHAEGGVTTASGTFSHAEGVATTASGNFSHAEGNVTTASGLYSHAEGSETVASGENSHAEGLVTTASGENSHAEGLFTSTNGFAGAHIMGQYGQATDEYSWFLANGTNPADLGLGAKIIGNDPLEPGVTNAYIDGAWIPGGADYAEMFETVDGQPIEPGYFVTLHGKKIRKAQAGDDYILGVTSANYSVLANSGEMRWKDKYLTDEWGRVQRQEVVVPAVTGANGSVITPERKQLQPVLNPAWDNTREYVSRLKRPEWVPVGLLGQVLVRDDGNCRVNGYCAATGGGIATAAPTGYRVLERTGDRQVLILFITGLNLAHTPNIVSQGRSKSRFGRRWRKTVWNPGASQG